MKKSIIAIIIVFSALGISALYFLVLPYLHPSQDLNLINIASGKIEKLDNDSLEISFVNPGNLVTTIGEKTYITLGLNKKTRYLWQTDEIKDQEEFAKEQNKFNQYIKNLTDENKEIIGIEAPSWFKYKDTVYDDLKIGQNVEIYISRSQINDKTKLAKKVIIRKENLNVTDLDKVLASVSGMIGKIDGQMIILDITDPLRLNSKEAKEKNLISILVNDKTLITRQRLKSVAQFEKEQKDYNLKVGQFAGDNKKESELNPPSWYAKENIKLSDLKPGGEIEVRSYSYSAKSNQEIVAEEITLK